MIRRVEIAALALAAFIATPAVASGQVLYLDNFDSSTAADYIIRQDPDTLATFGYNYSADGIPEAPRSALTGATAPTQGVKFQANYSDATGTAAALNISPAGRSFTGEYRLRFDVWLNANGPFPEGGTGSTEFITGGVGTTAAGVQKSTTGATGAWFAADNEGNSGIDYRAYLNSALQGPTSTVYTAPDSDGINRRNANNPYYHTAFPGGQMAPQSQQDAYAQQTGALKPGTIGFGWHEFEVSKIGDDVEWMIDGLSIARFTDPTLAGDNVFVGYWDVFASISDNPALSFGVVDNIRVEVIPEPTSLSLAALGGLVLLGRRRRR